MTKYILLDFMNLAFRAKHVVYNSDIDIKIGLAMHTMLNSIRYVNRKFGGEHLVVCLEGNSWRKAVYKPYKAHRKVKQLEKSIREQEDDTIFIEAMNEFAAYLTDKTNATVLQCPVAEADDMIAIWCDMHPNDHHTIVSSDSDYLQMISESVDIYNGVSEEHITPDGYFKDKRVIIDKKTKKPKAVPNPDYMLFEKCIRGDASDNIMSAYPGVRKAGTKNQVGIVDAFEDMDSKGYNWNNFMLQKWIDHDGEECRVLDRYNENRSLIDLRAQPDDIKKQCIASVIESVRKEHVRNVGVHFMRYCGVWDLNRIAEYPDEFAKILNKPYTGEF